MAVLRENDLATGRPPMPSLTTTLGGITAAACSRCRSRHDLRIRHGHELRAGALVYEYTPFCNGAGPTPRQIRRFIIFALKGLLQYLVASPQGSCSANIAGINRNGNPARNPTYVAP